MKLVISLGDGMLQMLAFELKDAALQAELDALAEVLDNDERYRPVQFARLLRNL